MILFIIDMIDVINMKYDKHDKHDTYDKYDPWSFVINVHWFKTSVFVLVRGSQLGSCHE